MGNKVLKCGNEKKHRFRKNLSPLMIIICLVLVVYTISLLFPLLWGLLTSLKGEYELRYNMFGLPETWEWENFLKAFNSFRVRVMGEDGQAYYVYLESMLLNSLLYAVGCAVIQSFVTCIVAYVTAKFEHFFFSKVIYTTVLIVMMLPIVGSMPSEIALAQTLGIYDTIWGMWIMKFNFLGMYYLVFHAMFKGIPKAYAEAAYIDGASEWMVMTKVMLPMAKNTLAIVIVLNFIGYWNDYQTPMLYMPSYPTMAYGLYSFANSTEQALANVPMQLTGCIVLMLPALILFLIFKEKLIGNISMGGLKE